MASEMQRWGGRHAESDDKWLEVRLGDVAELQTGFPFKSEHYVEGPSEPRLIRGDNIAQGLLRWDGVKRWPLAMAFDLEAYWLREGDVVLAMDRPWIEAGLKYAAIRRADLPALLVQRVARLRGTTTLDTRFLYYVIGSHGFTNYVLGVQTGTTVPHISASQIRDFSFSLPPLSVQRAIAQILGTLDDKINLLRRMNQVLEEAIRATFQSWFVDFEPVRSKAAGQRPSGVDPETAKLFPDEFVDSAIGLIPKGWRVVDLQDCGTWVSGGTPSKSEPSFWGGNIPWISAKSLTDFCIVDSELMLTSAGVQAGTRLVPGGSTLFVVRGMSLAKEFRVGITDRPMTLNQDLKAIVPDKDVEGSIIASFLLFQRDRVLSLTDEASHGTKRLQTSRIESLSFALPPVEQRRALSKSFDLMIESMFNRARMVRTLGELRDLLLPKLLSGDLRVSDAERFVENGGCA